jgi:hypothetical protein
MSGSTSQQSDPAADRRDAVVERLKVAAQQGKVVAEQLNAAADRLQTTADRLQTAADHPAADASADRGDDTVDRLLEAASDVRTVRLGLTALRTTDRLLEADLKDLEDLEDLELYLTEKTLRDTRNEFRLDSSSSSTSGIVDFAEITNLVIIDRYPKLKKALDLWYQRDKDLKAKIAQKESRRSDVRNQIYNIIGWYAVYLGVVLTAVSQLTQTARDHPVSLCRKVYFPILLTALGFLATIGGLWLKFRDLSSLESTISDDRKTSDELNRRALKLGRQGLKFDFLTEIKESKVPKNNSIGEYLVYFALSVFLVVFIVSYCVILCDKPLP